MTQGNTMHGTVLAEVLRDAHRYAPGTRQGRPTIVDGAPARARPLELVRERVRDLVERTAARAGFARMHFDPVAGASRLDEVMALSDQLEATYAALADERSKRHLIDILKYRVLGPYHAPLAITPGMFRARQAWADRHLLERRSTIDVSDPYFSPLSLYRVPTGDGSTITLHSHSVDIASVYLLDQYAYRSGTTDVGAKPGDVVFDVGGCWGDTALQFAHRVGPRGKVFTFEFDPKNLDVMRVNLALNPRLASRVEVIETALWDRSGERLAFVEAGRMSSVARGVDEAAGLSTATITLDDFVDEAGHTKVDFIKMDVEGAEPRVLEGARSSIQRFWPKLAVAAYHRSDDLVCLPELLRSLGVDYRFFLATASPLEEETVLFATR